MKKLISICAFLALAIFCSASPSVGDIKLSQNTNASPPSYKDVFITPVDSGLWGFDSSGHPVGIALGTNLTLVGTTLNATGGGGSGNVTSVGLSAPSIFTVSGSPVTTSGTLTFALNNQSSRLFFAGPGTGSTAPPGFRAIVDTDIPSITSAKISDFNTAAAAAAPVQSVASRVGVVTLTKSDVGLGNVENTALSTWAGSANITTVGTVGTGTWNATVIADGKIASALTGKTYNGVTPTALATGFSIAGGTTSKTTTFSNTLTFAGTDGSTLNIGGGGALGSAAFTAASAYEVPLTFSTGLTRTGNTITANAVNLAASGSGGVTGITPVLNGGNGTATPGIVAGTNVTVSGTWPNQTINSTASGTGNVSNSGTPSSGQAAEWVSATAIQGVAVTGTANYVKQTSPTLKTSATITANAATTTPISPSVLYLAGADATATGVTMDAFGSTPTIRFRQSQGTGASPTATQSGNVLGQFSARGFGATVYNTGSRGSLSFYATENYTDSANGSRIGFNVTLNGTTTVSERLSINNDGTLTASAYGAGVAQFDSGGNITSASVPASAMPALTGDVTTTAGTVATTVGKINGVSLSGLATGILKNTTTTGVPSIASPGSDYEVPITAGTGLTRTTNTFSVNSSQSIGTLSNLTTNGFVKTSGGTGALSVDTNTYITGNQTITLSGDVTGSGSTAITATLANIPSGTTAAGSMLHTAIAAPSTPAAGKASVYVDSTSNNLAVKNDAGTVNHGVQTRTATANNWIRSIADDGSTTISQPAFTNVSGSVASTQMPALTGDATTSAGATVTTVGKVNGVTYGAAPSTNTVPVVTGTNATTYATVPNAALTNSAITIQGNSVSLGGSALATTSTPQFARVGLGAGADSTAQVLAENDTLGATSTDGIILKNGTAATAGNQKWSPRIHYIGQGWKTNATAGSQTVDFINELRPVQGTANPSGLLAWGSQINGGGYLDQLTLDSNGNLTATGTIIGSTINQSVTTTASPTFAGQTLTAIQLIDLGTGTLPSKINPDIIGRFSNADVSANGFEFDAFGSTVGLNFRSYVAGGTRASPSATPDGTKFFRLLSYGYDTAQQLNRRAEYEQVADGLWSSSNNGAYHIWIGTPNGSTTSAEWMRLQNGILTVSGGYSADAGGMKHKRVSTGSISGASTTLVTVTWTTAFPDTNYTVEATVQDSTTSSLSLSVVHIESVTASAVTVRVLNNAAGALTGTLHVVAIHD